MASAWHKHTTYDTIIIRQYTSLLNCSLDHLDRKDTPSEVKTIKEPEQINTILQMLDILPSEGGIMKSFADTIDYMVLELWLGDQKENIKIYGGQVKMPSTGYMTDEGDKINERLLLEYIRNILKRSTLNKIKGYLLNFIKKI